MSPNDGSIEPPADSSGSQWETAERIVKFGTSAIAVIYTVGFLVVATAHARYGIIMFDLFRSRVLAAGLLITLLVLLPVIMGRRVYDKWLAIKNKPPGLAGYFVLGVILLWVWVVVACQFYPLFPGNSRTSLTCVFGCCLGDARLCFCIGVGRAFFQPQTSWFPSDATGPIGNPQLLRLRMFSGALFALTIWLIIFTAAPVAFSRFITREKAEGRKTEWYFASAGYCIVAVIAFTHLLYFKIKPAWGGGLPQHVTVNLTKSIPFSNSGNVQAFLIDETDKGYYLTHKADDHRASFVPRDAVGSIDFEEVK
jgi:hypothetical protein